MSRVCSQHASASNMTHAHDAVRLEHIRHGQGTIVAPVPNNAQYARPARCLLSSSSVSTALIAAHEMPSRYPFAILSPKPAPERTVASASISPNVGACTAACPPQQPASPRLQLAPASAPSGSTCPVCSSAPLVRLAAAGPLPPSPSGRIRVGFFLDFFLELKLSLQFQPAILRDG